MKGEDSTMQPLLAGTQHRDLDHELGVATEGALTRLLDSDGKDPEQEVREQLSVHYEHGALWGGLWGPCRRHHVTAMKGAALRMSCGARSACDVAGCSSTLAGQHRCRRQGCEVTSSSSNVVSWSKCRALLGDTGRYGWRWRKVKRLLKVVAPATAAMLSVGLQGAGLAHLPGNVTDSHS